MPDAPVAEATRAFERPSRASAGWRPAARASRRLSPRLLLGVAGLLLFGLAALLAGTVAPFDPSRTVGPPLQPPYSSASWWWPWPPSCSAAPAASRLPPDQSMSDAPVFHQLEPFNTTARQSISKVDGKF